VDCCVNILVLGGSVPCGSGRVRRGETLVSWPSRLQDYSIQEARDAA